MTGPQKRDRAAQIAVAVEVVKQPQTCEGCAHLRTHLRPMCQGESSPHWRQPRDTYHTRCEAYAYGPPKPAVTQSPGLKPHVVLVSRGRAR